MKRESVFARRLSPTRLARATASRLADLLIPPVCLSCHEPLAGHNNLCATCWRQVSFITHPRCDRLGIPLPFDPGNETILSAAALAYPPLYDRARAVAHYSDVMRKLIHSFKYTDQHTPRHLFTRWLQQAGRELLHEDSLIIPVPLHRRRLLARRFNQSAILAQDLANAAQLRYEPAALIRKRKTASQVGLTRDQRRRNLQGAFAVTKHGAARIKDRAILLVDDVITTGTTITACARNLKRAGAATVDVIVLAMVTDDSRINP